MFRLSQQLASIDQGSYKANIAQAVTLYSICRIVADSDWTKANLSKA